MQKFYAKVVNSQKKILVFFLAMAVVGAILQSFVKVNYDMKDYLPEDSKSTVSLEKMNAEFEGGIPNARVMVKNVTIPEALEYKERLKACEGVTEVMWLDDAVNIYQPLSMSDSKVVETYYKDQVALFTVTIEEHKKIEAVDAIHEVIGDENAMTGDAVSTAIATTSTVKEIRVAVMFAVLIVLLVLVLTTSSWVEPLIVLGGLGIAIMINSGSNLIFGEISFVTNAAGSILQLAVSLDYSIFLIHRYEECLLEYTDKKEAMVEALCKSTSSILSSGLTMVIGFLALLFMRFGIGPDLGMALAKEVAISLTTVFIFMPVLILKTYPMLEKTQHRRLLPEFKRLGKLVRHIMIPMACLFAIVMIPAFLTSNRNEFYYGSSHIFGEDTQLGRDTAAVEEIFGKNDTYAILVLLLSMKSAVLPVILVLTIETAIWVNMAIPYFWGAKIFYIAYLIISSIQLGATVDYAILLTDRYMEFRQTMTKKEAVTNVIPAVIVSLLTSGITLATVGNLLSKFSSHGILSQLGLYLGRGSLLLLASVIFVLPGLLYLFDGLIQKTTKGVTFYNPGKEI